jgi:hypothetical protein
LIAILLIVALVWLAFILVVPRLPFLRLEVGIDQEVVLDARLATVLGTTNLPDGAVLHFYFWHESDAENIGDFHSGSTIVEDGRFEYSRDLSDFGAGTVTAFTEFSIEWDVAQPPHVLDRFGSQGERLEGPQVVVDSPGDPRVLVAATQFELPPSATAPED